MKRLPNDTFLEYTTWTYIWVSFSGSIISSTCLPFTWLAAICKSTRLLPDLLTLIFFICNPPLPELLLDQKFGSQLSLVPINSSSMNFFGSHSGCHLLHWPKLRKSRFSYQTQPRHGSMQSRNIIPLSITPLPFPSFFFLNNNNSNNYNQVENIQISIHNSSESRLVLPFFSPLVCNKNVPYSTAVILWPG